MPIDYPLARLLQLSSPTLPIGLYSYSQGMERAVEDGWIGNEQHAEGWISGLLDYSLKFTDIPVLFRLHRAWENKDHRAITRWSRILLACRETSELREEDRHGGQALARLLVGLDVDQAKVWINQSDATLATCFSLAAVEWKIPEFDTALGYLWTWLENQVLCAVKLVPLGQVRGQQLLWRLKERLPNIIDDAMKINDDEIGGSLIGLALASSRHEEQYSRLYRS